MVAQVARPAAVFRLTCVNAPALALLCIVPAVAAGAEGEWKLASSLLPGSAVALLLWFFGRRSKDLQPKKIEVLVPVALSFVLAILLVSPAFVALGMPPVDALFEATSGITTTGLSLADGRADWPLSGHFLRAWMQWLGGFAFVAVALAVVIGRGVAARRLGAAEGIMDDRKTATARRARQLLGAYLLFTALAIVLLALLDERPLEGVLIAMSAVSTGGFAPEAASLAEKSLAMQGATLAVCGLGAIPLGVLWAARRAPGTLLREPEVRIFAALLVFVAAAVVMVETQRGAQTPGNAAFLALSAQATAGFTNSAVTELSPASMMILVFAMAIGGCLGSTAGGIKVFRFGFVASATRLTLLRTRTSYRAKTYLRLFGRKTDPREGTDIMGLLALYLLSAALVWLIMILSGVAAVPALFDSVSALSGVGLSAGAVSGDLPVAAKLALSAAMLLGRLEFLAVLALFNPGTWWKG